jgi:hypothetical protein
VCDSTHSLVYHWLKIDIWNIINIGFSLMKIYVCGSVMCNDEALNVVIFTINANIHVFVHVDLHEIYL